MKRPDQELVAEPFMITRRGLYRLYASSRLAQRLIAARWITVVRPGSPGRETLFDFQSAKAAYERFKKGEEPPLLACELRRRKP